MVFKERTVLRTKRYLILSIDEKCLAFTTTSVINNNAS